jgi:hypothetical protein
LEWWVTVKSDSCEACYRSDAIRKIGAMPGTAVTQSVTGCIPLLRVGTIIRGGFTFA